MAGSSGGAVATGGAGGIAGASAFWTSAYNPAGLPTPDTGNHNAGDECGSCHAGVGGGPAFMFAGTVYISGSTPAPNVEVGVRVGGQFYSAYSATNGNFWVLGTPIADWTNAEIRIRNENGEAAMSGEGDNSCNSCHQTGSRLLEP